MTVSAPTPNAPLPAPATPDRLLAYLESLGITVTITQHRAVFTIDESASLRQDMPGAHSKNLFLKDKKGRLFLVSARADARIDLKRLHEVIGASGRLSFGSEAQLMDNLGVKPGSVTAFAVINDNAGRVTMVLDAGLMTAQRLNFHPLTNTMTCCIARDDLLSFLAATGHDPLIVTLPES